jgi:hypothetical protein
VADAAFAKRLCPKAGGKNVFWIKVGAKVTNALPQQRCDKIMDSKIIKNRRTEKKMMADGAEVTK